MEIVVPAEESNDPPEPSSPRRKKWQSCCLTCDREAVEFFCLLGVSIGAMSFCVVQLSVSESCERDQLYTSLFTGILCLLFPSPRFRSSRAASS